MDLTLKQISHKNSYLWYMEDIKFLRISFLIIDNDEQQMSTEILNVLWQDLVTVLLKYNRQKKTLLLL